MNSLLRAIKAGRHQTSVTERFSMKHSEETSTVCSRKERLTLSKKGKNFYFILKSSLGNLINQSSFILPSKFNTLSYTCVHP